MGQIVNLLIALFSALPSVIRFWNDWKKSQEKEEEKGRIDAAIKANKQGSTIDVDKALGSSGAGLPSSSDNSLGKLPVRDSKD